MKKLLSSSFVLAIVASMSLLTGCSTPSGEGEGEGEGERPVAGEGEGEGSTTGEGEGEGSTAAGCGAGPACSATQVCTTIFQSTGGQSTQGCYNSCTAGQPCTTVTGAAGQCAADQAQHPICVATSPLNGPCGDLVNASCDPTVTRLCAQSPEGVGFCAKLCSMTDATTCSNPTQFGGANNACGCGADATALACSDDSGLGSDGVCMPPTTAGDTCGIDATTQLTKLCTGTQSCNLAAGQTSGTCQ